MQTIGKYQILGKIGEGAMGVIYRAQDPFLGRSVAIKALSANLLKDTESRQRFLREARLAGSLTHKNMVTIYDMGCEDDQVYLALEYLEGEDLTRRLRRPQRLSLEEKIRIIAEIAAGLAHAHQKGIVHRDVKPSNIFICESGEVKILDFGLARVAASELTRTGQVLGTPNYMSPEQVMGERVDPRADVFSLGAVFYEVLTLQKAFSGRSIEQAFHKIVHEEPEPIETSDPTVPVEICRIVRKAMTKRRQARYQNMDELLRDLEGARKSLDRRKTVLREEVEETVRKMTSLLRENHPLLDRGRKSLASPEPLGRLVSASRRKASGYMTLLGLRDGASLELRRLQAVLRKAGRGGEPMKSAGTTEEADADSEDTMTFPSLETGDRERARAKSLYQKAASRFTAGDLGGCLTLLSEVLRLEPAHPGANRLEEKLRSAFIQLVDREGERRNEEVVEAALLALEAAPVEERPAGGTRPAEAGRVSRV
ncbi:MAG: serine/threonine-protein kinase, partial [Acidobacteriota bacterium]